MLKYFYTILLAVLATGFASAQSPKQAVAFYKSGINLRDNGQFLDAVIVFKKAISLDKKYDSAYLALSALYTKISQADSAVLLMNTAVKTIPDFTAGYLALGNIYRDYKINPDEAIVNFSKALALDSTNKVALYSLAWCYNAKKDYREAIKYGIMALDIDNNYKPAYNELGHAYHQLKAFDECIAQFKKNLAISVNELPMLYTGYCYMEMNQKENAIKVYEELNKLNPRMGAALKKKLDAMP